MIAEVSDELPTLVAAAVVLTLALFSRRRAVLVGFLPVTIAWAASFGYFALVVDDPLRPAA